MDNIIQNEVIYEAHAPKGLRFSPAIVEEAKRCAVLTYEERKAQKEEIASSIQSLKDEFKSLRGELRVSVKEAIKQINLDYANECAKIDAEYQKTYNELTSTYQGLATRTKADDVEYKNSVKGIQIVAKRSKIKEANARDLRIKDEQVLLEYLYNDFFALYHAMRGTTHAPLLGAKRGLDVFCSTFSFKKFISNKTMWINLIPFMMLVCLIAAFYIAKAITGYGGDMTNVINNGVFIAIVATGAVFIYSSGSFDMSLGPASLMCATCAGIL